MKPESDNDDMDKLTFDGPWKVRAFGLTRIYPDAAAVRELRRRISEDAFCFVAGVMAGGLFAWAAACWMGVI